MNKKYANFLLHKTIDDYNKIATKFSMTRNYLSEDLYDMKKYAKSGAKILDLGCGNGRLSQLFDDMDVDYIGTDDSSGLLEIAKHKYPKAKFVSMKPMELPFEDAQFDLVYCLAVFHHIPSHELRTKYLEEVRRVLKPGGILVLTVWNMWKRPGMFWNIVKQGFFHPQLDLNDIFVPFKDQSGKIMANRYIHCFRDDSLEHHFMEAGFAQLKIEHQQRGKNPENGNILIVGKKQ
jgi:ubiquinone/menaquinone biosynthesis C-methylase UbiE